jgi:hypothetical protein
MTLINWQYSDLERVAEFHVNEYGYGSIESWSGFIKRHVESAYDGKATYISTYTSAFVVMIWHDESFKPHAKCAVTAYSALKAQRKE